MLDASSSTLVIDNYDSFTWNLVQLLGELGGDPVVIRNDTHSVEEILAMAPARVVISPGPCTPGEAGVSVELIRRLDPALPLLGVCLGHQSIGEAFGGSTIRAAHVMHGKTTAIRHRGEGLFQGPPSPSTVTRNHPLVTATKRLPECLEAVAWSGDPDGSGSHSGEEIQAMRHRQRPVWGVQFHPESLFSEGGRSLMGNFLRM